MPRDWFGKGSDKRLQTIWWDWTNCSLANHGLACLKPKQWSYLFALSDNSIPKPRWHRTNYVNNLLWTSGFIWKLISYLNADILQTNYSWFKHHGQHHTLTIEIYRDRETNDHMPNCGGQGKPFRIQHPFSYKVSPNIQNEKNFKVYTWAFSNRIAFANI